MRFSGLTEAQVQKLDDLIRHLAVTQQMFEDAKYYEERRDEILSRLKHTSTELTTLLMDHLRGR